MGSANSHVLIEFKVTCEDRAMAREGLGADRTSSLCGVVRMLPQQRGKTEVQSSE